ncbi:asparaginyl-trna synthetase [Pseudohyphozyma bogoriensis]|nr:asparaginyl-trna synthetase [Pseudohyphozyma bogoriensis]
MADSQPPPSRGAPSFDSTLEDIPTPPPRVQGPLLDTTPLEAVPSPPTPLGEPTGTPVIHVEFDPAVLEEGQRWEQERIERRLRGDYERATKQLSELVNDNLDKPFRLNAVTVYGANRTRASFLASVLSPYLPSLPSPSYSTSAPATPSQSLRSILHTSREVDGKLAQFGIFNDIQTTVVKSPSVLAEDDDVDIVVNVKEAGGKRLAFNADVGGDGEATTLAAEAPINGSPFTKAAMTLFMAERNLNHFAACSEVAHGAQLSFRTVSNYGAHELSYLASLRKICDILPLASISIRDQAGSTVKSSLTHTFVRDTRDDLVMARHGSHLKLQQEYAGLGGDVNYLKASGEYSISRTFAPSYSWSLGAKAGGMYTFGQKPSLLVDRFHLGGPTSVRMFKNSALGPKDSGDYLGGDLHWSTGASLVTPLWGKPEWPVKGHFFANAGHIVAFDNATKPYTSALKSLFTQPSVSVGLGLMYKHSSTTFIAPTLRPVLSHRLLHSSPFAMTNPISEIVHKVIPTTSHEGDQPKTEEEPRINPETGLPETKNEKKKREKAEEKERIKAEKEAARLEREAAAKAAKEAADVDYSPDSYGKLPLNQSQERTKTKRAQFKEITAANDGEKVTFRARLQTSRAQGAKMVFLVFRQQSSTIQALVQVEKELVSKKMVNFCEKINPESIVLVEGTVQKPLEEVKSCTVSDAEIKISKIFVESEAPVVLPFTMADASRPADDETGGQVALDTRLDNRVLDLRTITSQAIFQISSGVCNLFREYLNSQGFIEIHTPKLQGAATESGSSVFKVSYFKGNAYLAQSPQLAKQMCIAADMEKVYEIAPVFRAENSYTHRHMTEFMGLDLEMAFDEHYHEVMETIDGMLKSIFSGLKTKYADQIAVINKQYPHEEFTFLDETLVLQYGEAIKILQEAQVMQPNEQGEMVPIGDHDDMNTTTEKALGVLIKEKYKTDYYIIDKFPSELRPFYTMPDPSNPVLSNSYDFFMRGEEILSGAQRVHDAELLESNMKKVGINPEEMKDYVDAFRLGAPPHAGGGIGLERVVMLFLKLGNIRRASLFPRDPKRLNP